MKEGACVWWCVAAWLVTLGAPVLTADQPNIVYILTDDQGYNDVSWINEKVITPNLQSLVNDGVLLDHNYVQPLCTPTRSSFMTGFYPYHLGRQRFVILPTEPTGLTTSKTLLPEKLHDLGYKNHAIGKWHLGFCDWDYTPLRRGFDTFYGFYQGGQDYFTHQIQGGYDFRDNEDALFEANGTYSATLYADRAVKVIEEEATDSKPFFMYLALQSIHTPLQVPDEYLDYYPEGFNQTYFAMVTAMDDVVGRVVEALRSTGQMDNTLLIFSSDNGALNPGNNAPLRGNKGSLWEGGTRVPGLMYSPLLQNTPRKYNGVLHVTDWYNTLLTVAGADTLPDNDGFNQWEALRTGNGPLPRDSMIYNLDENLGQVTGAIRVGKYKYIRMPVREELFDLESDPYETTNLLDEKPDVTTELKDLLLAQMDSLVPADNPPFDSAGNADNFEGVWQPGWCTAH